MEVYSASRPDGLVAVCAVPVRGADTTCTNASLHHGLHLLSSACLGGGAALTLLPALGRWVPASSSTFSALPAWEEWRLSHPCLP